MAMTDVPTFARKQLALLDAELQAELAETSSVIAQLSPASLQRAGLAITNLVLSSQRTGLGGKTVIELEADPARTSGAAKEHGIRTGDIVRIQEQAAGTIKGKDKGEKYTMTGVVTRVRSGQISVALDKEEENVSTKRLWVVKMANEVTYKRMKQTMASMLAMPTSAYPPLMRVLFGLSSPTPIRTEMGSQETVNEEISFMDTTLNASQQDAVRFALASAELALIHGPPGTGKTYTLIELIRQLVTRNQRILVCGPSNISVDNIVERLAVHGVPMIRLGHPARLLPSVLDHSLDMLTHTSDAAAIVRDIRREMDAKRASIRKTKSGRERKAIYDDLTALRKDFRVREKRCAGDLIRASKVVLATLHGAGGYLLQDQAFDAVIIDEASQALEAQCWVPLLSAKKVILAGDHLQLPPTVKSQRGGSRPTGMTLETTLFDRVLARYGDSIKRLLTTQYRMHETIMRFPSDELYGGALMAADGVKGRLLSQLAYGVTASEATVEPLIFWDTQGGDFPEQVEDGSPSGKARPGAAPRDSKCNEMEVGLVSLHLSRLIQAGVHPDDIAVITPYNAQVASLAQRLKDAFPGVELGSVDGFQGREKEAVILSLVRSNGDGDVGFLGDRRRLNVAMTRPKRQLCVIGDSQTVGRYVAWSGPGRRMPAPAFVRHMRPLKDGAVLLSGSAFLARWMAFLEEHADLRYPDVMDVVAPA